MGDVTYALGGQRVAGLAAFAMTLNETPSINEGMHHLADPTLGDAEPKGQMLTGDHRVVGDEVEGLLLRGADAQGQCSLQHPLGTG